MKTLGQIAAAILAGIFSAFVLSVLWSWFIPVIFPGLPALPWRHMFAVLLIISAFKGLGEKSDRSLEESLVENFFFYATALLLGYLFKVILF